MEPNPASTRGAWWEHIGLLPLFAWLVLFLVLASGLFV